MMGWRKGGITPVAMVLLCHGLILCLPTTVRKTERCTVLLVQYMGK